MLIVSHVHFFILFQLFVIEDFLLIHLLKSLVESSFEYPGWILALSQGLLSRLLLLSLYSLVFVPQILLFLPLLRPKQFHLLMLGLLLLLFCFNSILSESLLILSPPVNLLPYPIKLPLLPEIRLVLIRRLISLIV